MIGIIKNCTSKGGWKGKWMSNTWDENKVGGNGEIMFIHLTWSWKLEAKTIYIHPFQKQGKFVKTK